MPNKKARRNNNRTTKRDAPEGKIIDKDDKRNAIIGRAMGARCRGKGNKKPGKKDCKRTKAEMDKNMADFLCGGSSSRNLNSCGLDALRVATRDGEYLDFRNEPERLREMVYNQMINHDCAIALASNHQHLDTEKFDEMLWAGDLEDPRIQNAIVENTLETVKQTRPHH